MNLTSLIPGVGEAHEHVATYGIVAAGLLVLGFAAKAQLAAKGEAAVIPDGKLSLRGLFELLTEFIRSFVDMVIGEHGRKFTPMFTAIFVIVFANNLVGILPGMSPATEQINTTLAMGTIMFLVYNFWGIKENGIGYVKHFLGPVWWLAPLMVIIEIISHAVRPLTLGLRLANVMTGDHTVVGIFTDLVPLVLPIPFYVLGLFVCFIQAFVFTLLSMVYIALATAHDH